MPLQPGVLSWNSPITKPPANDYGIIISYGRSFVSLLTDSGESVIWQSSEIKTGGLTVDQARG